LHSQKTPENFLAFGLFEHVGNQPLGLVSFECDHHIHRIEVLSNLEKLCSSDIQEIYTSRAHKLRIWTLERQRQIEA
jgi:hypothetical protein